MDSHPFNRDMLIRAFFFGAFALILYQLILLSAPFFTAIAGAAMLAMIFYPLHRRILRAVRQRNVAAFLSTLGVLLLAVLPLVWLGWYFVRETSQLVPAAQSFLDGLRSRDWPTLQARLPEVLRNALDSILGIFARLHVDLKRVILDNAQEIGVQATAWGTRLVKNILLTLLNGLMLAVSLFFAFRDGEAMLQWAVSLIPMRPADKLVVKRRVYETFQAIVVGTFLTSAVQGIAAMIGFFIAGIQLPIVLGIATIIAALLGASVLVTVPVAVSVLRDSSGWGIFLLIWGVGVVGLIDNLLKPILIGSRARMPVIVIFFSIVGGMKLYGVLGFFLGPMLVASFLSFVKIYQEQYEER